MYIDKWPDGIAWIVKELKPDAHREMIETRMESGHVKRRPRHTAPIPILRGTVTVNAAEKAALWAVMPNAGDGPVEITHPRTGAPGYISFFCPPHQSKQSITVGRPETERFVLELVFRDVTADVERLHELNNPGDA